MLRFKETITYHNLIWHLVYFHYNFKCYGFSFQSFFRISLRENEDDVIHFGLRMFICITMSQIIWFLSLISNLNIHNLHFHYEDLFANTVSPDLEIHHNKIEIRRETNRLKSLSVNKIYLFVSTTSNIQRKSQKRSVLRSNYSTKNFMSVHVDIRSFNYRKIYYF